MVLVMKLAVASFIDKIHYWLKQPLSISSNPSPNPDPDPNLREALSTSFAVNF